MSDWMAEMTTPIQLQTRTGKAYTFPFFWDLESSTHLKEYGFPIDHSAS